MKRIYLITFFTLFICSLNHAQQLHYTIDDAHSNIKFVGLLGDMMEVEGKFSDFWGDVFFDPEHPEDLSVTVVIDPTSLDTDSEWRDSHLQKEEFLHTEAHDVIVFKSSSNTKVDESLSGQLLLKGQERPITINYKKEFGPKGDPWQNQRITFTGSFTFSRSAFDLGPTEGFWGEGISDEAKVVFAISATRQNMDRMGIFEQENVAAVWDKLVNNDIDQALIDIETILEEVSEKGKKRIPKMIDLLAKRARQYDLKEAYLALLEKNTVLFPEKDWVFSQQALGFWENGDQEATKKAAEKALYLNSKNALALELLK